MSFDKSPSVRAAVSDGAPVLFLSAHLDDAVLSCGALMEALVPRCPVTVVTLFTEASAPPHTYAGRSYLRQCGAGTAASLYADRRAEDREVLAGLGVDHVHIPAMDALYRTRNVPPLVAALGRAVPELIHRYPTYRYDIAKGRVSRGDRGLIADLGARIDDLVSTMEARVVFCPIGVGRNVDHLITRSVGGRHRDRVIYYSDYPYNLSATPDRGFIDAHRLEPWTWDDGIAEKSRLIRGYRTQVNGLFPDGEIAEHSETYFQPSAASAG